MSANRCAVYRRPAKISATVRRPDDQDADQLGAHVLRLARPSTSATRLHDLLLTPHSYPSVGSLDFMPLVIPALPLRQSSRGSRCHFAGAAVRSEASVPSTEGLDAPHLGAGRAV